MRRFLFVLVVLCSFLSAAHAQVRKPASEIKPGVVLVRIRAEYSGAIRQAFTAARPASDPTFSHSDIHRASLRDDAAIQQLLGIPDALHGLTLKPYLPTHSIAFEDIRERSNPSLFTRSMSAKSTATNAELASAEDKISRWFVLSFENKLSPIAVSKLVAKSAAIEVAEPKLFRYPCYTPNDSLVPQQYALTLLNAFKAWDVVRCDSTMIVADVDIGTDWTHPDLQASIFLNQGEIGIDSNGLDKRANGVDDDGNGFIDDWHGWDFDGNSGATPDNDARTTASHGTHTAGILAATGDNTTGIAGVAFGARVIPLKVSDDNGQSLDFGFEGITYAADMHAKVVSCSWGGPTKSQAEQDVIDYSFGKDCAVVAAAGNNGNGWPYQDFFPAAYNHVLSVSAIDAGDNLSSFSNYNTHVDVAAPGEGVLSTVPGGFYQQESGTSMACPNAAGSVALVRQRFPQLTAGQAAEQVRATSRPFTNLDSARIDYEGHGRIDAYRAVTDSNAHSARIIGYTIADDGGKGHFIAGDNGGIVVNVMNYLKPVHSLHAYASTVTGGEYVSLVNQDIRFGTAQTLQEVSNIQANFRVRISDSVPANTVITMKLVFLDESVGYDSDYDYLSFIVNPGYLNLDQNNILTTVTSKGAIGFEDAVSDAFGSGFVWQHIPPSISPKYESTMFQGGLMLAVDSQHLVDVVMDATSNKGDTDLSATELVHYVKADHIGALQQINCAYSDANADPNYKFGVSVSQQSYEFSAGLAANAVVLRYVFRKTVNDSLHLVNDNFAAALYTDWDLGLSGALNITRFDSATGIAITNRIEPNYPVAGMKLLSPLPQGAELQYHAIRNDGADGDINTYDGFDKREKWTALTVFRPTAGPTDVSHSFGVKHLPLLSQDSIVMVIALALAENTDLIKSTLAQTQRVWDQTAGVAPNSTSRVSGLTAFPNPCNDILNVHWSSESSAPAQIALLDMLGRVVATESASNASASISTSELPSGFYLLSIHQGDRRYTQLVRVAR